MKKTERFTVQKHGSGAEVKSPEVSSVCIDFHVLGQGHHGGRRCTKRRCPGSEHWPDDVWPIVAGHEPSRGLVARGTWAGGQAWVQELVV